MKKLIWIILLLIPICHVKAEFYYSDYTDWKKVEKIPDLPADLFEVKEEKEYLWYQLERVGNYFKKAEDHHSFPYETNFWKYGNWSSWQSEKVEASEEVEVQTRKIYDYQTMKPIRFIKLSDFSSDQMIVSNIHVYNQNREISFQERKDGATYILELSEPCYIDELEVGFTLIDMTKLEKNFTIEWMYDLDSPSSMYEQPRLWFQGSFQVSYYYRNMLEHSIVWDPEIKQSLEKVENKIHQMVWEREEYRYREKMHYYEKEIKTYDSDYRTISLPDFPYKDESTVRTVLQVRTREKINLDFSSIKNEIHDLLEKQMMETEKLFSLFTQSQNEKLEQFMNQTFEKEFGKQLSEIMLVMKEENLKFQESLEQIMHLNQQNTSKLENQMEMIYQKMILKQKQYDQLQKKKIEEIKKIISKLEKLEGDEKKIVEEILLRIEKLREDLNQKTKNILRQLSNSSMDQKFIHLKEEQSENLSQQFEEMKATLMSFQNSQSEQEIKQRQSIPIKKQSTSFPIFIFLFLIGILIGRIVTMKKNF